MATCSVGLILPANDVQQLAHSANHGEILIQIAIMNAIAIVAAATSCTVDLTGYSARDINNVMNLGRGCGYEVSFSGVTLTIRW
jgi:hypothetical protein